MNRNIPIFGFLIGILFPVLGMLILYLVKFSSQPLTSFMNEVISSKRVASMVLSLSLIANLLPFIYYTNKRLDLTARGILVATVLYAVVIVLLKFVW